MSTTPHQLFTVNKSKVIRKLLIGCIGFELFLVLIDAGINYGRWLDIGAIRRLCNIAREDGLATWFQVSQTLLAGVTLWSIWLLCKKRGSPKPVVLGWSVLAGFFTFMSADDGAEIHERIGTTFGTLVKSAGAEPSASSLAGRLLDSFPSYNWQLVVLPVFIALGLFMLYFLWRQMPPTRGLLLLAVGCFALAVGLDFMEGLDQNHPANIYSHLQMRLGLSAEWTSHFSRALEEFLEMLGISLLWSLFLGHLIDQLKNGIALTATD